MSARRTRVVLVTGVSGSGKTAVARELTRLGCAAVSLDSYPGLCGWADADGNPVTRPAEPSLEWLAGHNWVWDASVLTELVAAWRISGDGTVFLTGVSASVAEHASLFDRRVLLKIDAATMLARLANPSRTNDFGRAGATSELLRTQFAGHQAWLEALCDNVIDANAGLDLVVRRVLGFSDEGDPSA